MLPNYSDITSRLGPPRWYDANGVPRYEAFSPDMCGVYVDHIAYMEIACQACDQRFMVVSETSRLDRDGEPLFPCAGTKSECPWDTIGSFHYGDPPRHEDCAAGATMNSVPIRVVEFWTRHHFDWQRVPAHEVSFPTLQP